MTHNNPIKASLQPSVRMTQAAIDAGEADHLDSVRIIVVDNAGASTGDIYDSGPLGSSPTPATPGSASVPLSFQHPASATPPAPLALTQALHGGRSWHAESDVTALTLAATDFPGGGTEIHVINHAGVALPIRIGAGLTGYQNTLGASQAGVAGANHTTTGLPDAVLDTLGPLERCIIQTKEGQWVNVVKFGGSGGSRERAWAPNTFYEAGEVVLATVASGTIRVGDRMASLADHTSSATFAADQATQWAEQPMPSDYMPKSTAAQAVKGNPTAATTDGTDITVAQDRLVGRDGAGDLGGVQVKTNHIANDQVTNAKLANVLANTVKATAVAGDPADLAVGANQLVGREATGNVKAVNMADLPLSDAALRAAYSDNLIFNHGADRASIEGWASVEGVGNTLAAATDDKRSGDHSFKITGTGTHGFGFRAIPINPDEKYLVSVWVRSTSGASTGTFIRMNERTAYPTGDLVTSANRSTLVDLQSNGPTTALWEKKTFVYTPTAGTQWASFSIYKWTGLSAQALWFDEVSVRQVLPTSALDPKVLIEADVVDALTSDSAAAPLSAKQGKALDTGKVDKITGKGLSTNDYTTTDKNKVGFISVTQAVDLDAIETRVNNLDAAIVLKGTWNASAGTFPGGGTAQAGESYIVSAAGTVNGVAFAINDRIIAILDNASTTTFANNWFKADYTDLVTSVAGKTGAVSLLVGDVANALSDSQSPAVVDWAASTVVRANELRRATANSVFQGILTGGLIRSNSARTTTAWSDTEASNWTAVSEKVSNFVSGATDPNTLTTPGIYVSTTGAAHANLFNAIGGWAIEVTAVHTGLAGGPKLIQEGRSVSGVAGTTPGDLETYRRVSNNNGANWSAWERVLEPSDVVRSTVAQAVQSAGFTAAWGNKYPIDASAGALTITLASAVGQALQNIDIVRQDSTANAVTVVAATGERFFLLVPTDNAEAFTLASRGKVSLTSNGTLPVVTDTNGIATVSRLWLPTDASVDPYVWYNFRDPAGLTLSGTAVTAVTNLGTGGAGYNIVQATAAAQPTINNATDPQYATFDGSSDWMGTAAAQAAMMDIDDATLVMLYSASGSKQTSILDQPGITGGQINYHPRWSDGTTYLDLPLTSARISANRGTEFANGVTNPIIAVGWRDSGSMALYGAGNQTASISGTGKTGTPSGSGTVFVGATTTNTNHLNGRVYEIILYRSALTADERDRLAAYMAWAIGAQATLHTSNPYRNAPPTFAL